VEALRFERQLANLLRETGALFVGHATSGRR
jgi:Holliday junction resolvase